jgi:hypothetical protein
LFRQAVTMVFEYINKCLIKIRHRDSIQYMRYCRKILSITFCRFYFPPMNRPNFSYLS